MGRRRSWTLRIIPLSTGQSQHYHTEIPLPARTGVFFSYTITRPRCERLAPERTSKRRYLKLMLKIIRHTIRYYLILCGIALNGIVIHFLIAKTPSIKELVMPTPEEFIQVFTYGKCVTATAMFALLVVSICASFLDNYEKSRSPKIPHNQSERGCSKHANARHQQK